MKLRVLGSGTSSGVPRIGNDWGDCDPGDPRNRRRRASILIEHDGKNIIVDTGPDCREQLLDANVATLDAVIWTHEHADHCHGIDELRGVYFNNRGTVQGYARERTQAILTDRFPYAFQGFNEYPAYASVDLLPDDSMIAGVRVRVVDLPHGPISSAAMRFDIGDVAMAYATDFNELTDEARKLFKGVDLWVVDSVRRRPHPTHPHLAQVLRWIDDLGVKQAALTHLDQSMDYVTLKAELPEHVEPAYDGLEFVW
ncbi:MBL fold metallo-hydrolase [Novosphingopyxis sp. YJ-S2-01]|uniref:MBL fold metallo-hydrolase n=1 Tax=Novosphingopyxis sp. YJ-S2-01 TaxID=2794021 RepID=UPI0018DD8C28|nr:MBL fold metallo-hydrolase [Novosphingopyxis sp. YJ-S2-01]